MRYSITSKLRFYHNFEQLGKIFFSFGKNGILSILALLRIAEFLAVGKTLNIYIDYLMFYSSRQHVKSKFRLVLEIISL